MMRLFVVLFLSILSSVACGWNQREPNPVAACQIHAPYGFPQSSKPIQPICRQAYLVGYDAAAKIPEFVMYELTPPNALGCVARSNAFAADQSVPNGATPTDYIGTNYDKGHMAPDGDLSWDTQVEFESFLMTNMSPQAGSLNRGIWKLLETSVRGWVVQHNQSYTIVSGGLYGPGDKTIGKGVVVPHGFYKIVINNQTNEVAGWEFPHVAPYPSLGNNLTKFRVSVSQIMQTAGVKYAFPSNMIELAPGKEWTIDFGKLTQSKHAKCGANTTDD
jgi:endonuclease G